MRYCRIILWSKWTSIQYMPVEGIHPYRRVIWIIWSPSNGPPHQWWWVIFIHVSHNHRICLIFGKSWLSFTPVSTVLFCDAPGIASGSDSSAPACAVDQTTRIACSATALRWMDWRRWRTRWSLWWSFPATAQDQSNWVSCGFYWWGKMSGKVWVWLVRQSGRT